MSRRSSISLVPFTVLLMGMLAARTPVGTHAADQGPAERGLAHAEFGLASYYGTGFNSLLTASGEPFDQDHMTAAHRTLPFGTRVRVTNLRNRRSAVVRINDRGPFVKGRVVDLSYAAARRLRLQARGTERVRIEVLTKAQSRPQRSSGESG